LLLDQTLSGILFIFLRLVYYTENRGGARQSVDLVIGLGFKVIVFVSLTLTVTGGCGVLSQYRSTRSYL